MIQIDNITGEAYQRHIIAFDPAEIVVKLRYAGIVQCWFLDVEYQDWAIYGVKLSVGTLHIRQENKPFDFVATDESGNGIDPCLQTDFDVGRCKLVMLEADDMELIRGVPVP